MQNFVVHANIEHFHESLSTATDPTALTNLFDAHSAAVCGLRLIDHVHAGGIVPSITAEAVADVLAKTRQAVRRAFGRAARVSPPPAEPSAIPSRRRRRPQLTSGARPLAHRPGRRHIEGIKIRFGSPAARDGAPPPLIGPPTLSESLISPSFAKARTSVRKGTTSCKLEP